MITCQPPLSAWSTDMALVSVCGRQQSITIICLFSNNSRCGIIAQNSNAYIIICMAGQRVDCSFSLHVDSGR